MILALSYVCGGTLTHQVGQIDIPSKVYPRAVAHTENPGGQEQSPFYLNRDGRLEVVAITISGVFHVSIDRAVKVLLGDQVCPGRTKNPDTIVLPVVSVYLAVFYP